MFSSTKSKLITLVVVLGIVGAVGWKLGWWDRFISSSGDRKDKDKKDDRDKKASLVGIDKLMVSLHATDDADRKKIDDEIKQNFKDDWKSWVDKLNDDIQASEGKKDRFTITPYLILTTRDAGALGDLFKSDRMPLQEMLAARKYLQSWRAHLAELRQTARKAGLHEFTDEQRKKLDEFPTLRLLAELASDQLEYKALDKPRTPSRLPWLGAEDKETAEALHRLLIKSEAGAAFAASKDGLNLDARGTPQLRLVLAACHARANALIESFPGEVSDAVVKKLGPDRKALMPCQEAFSAAAGDLQKNKLPALLAPDAAPKKP